MKVRFIIYETEKWVALERTYDGVAVVPRIGEHVALNTAGYDDTQGLVRRVVHWPTTLKNQNPHIDAVADVFVRVSVEDVDHYRVNDASNWKPYDWAYDFNDPKTIEAS